MSKLGVDGLQQQQISSGSTPVSEEQESDCTVDMGSQKLDRKRLRNVTWSFFKFILENCPEFIVTVVYNVLFIINELHDSVFKPVAFSDVCSSCVPAAGTPFLRITCHWQTVSFHTLICTSSLPSQTAELVSVAV